MQETNIEQIRSILATTAAQWSGLTRDIPVELLRQAPAAGEWSALECLQHLVDTEEWVFPHRVECLLAGQDFPAFDPDSEGRRPATDQQPDALATRFGELRATSLSLFARITLDDLSRTARHSQLGKVTLNELLNEWPAHDLMHTVQAECALMQPFIAGCGPWQPYFQDHDAMPGDRS